MKVGYRWIQDFVDLDVDVHDAAWALTMSGTEVESVAHETVPAEVICALIVDAAKHPNADRLFVCTVDTGKETLQVVCGAPNTRPGIRSAFAPVGTVLADGMTVKKAKIRGVESMGVLLSERELGLTDDHTGIMELDDDIEIGAPLAAALGLEDWVLDVGVTPNRGDCLSVIGIARELAALFGKTLKLPRWEVDEIETPARDVLSVEILDPSGCPRYAARYMDGVTIAKSPFPMRRRLFQSGVRAINNVVDITNYVMLELGQPLHAFDATLIEGSGIVVRTAKEGESFVTLDSVERRLSRGDLLICDRARPVALAGIMGGENSEVLPTTTSVVLESAYFNPGCIRRTSRSLGLSTEASYRFERGVDPGMQVTAADRAACLMVRHAGARVYRGAIDVNHLEAGPKTVGLRASALSGVLGIGSTDPAEVRRIFEGLGCRIEDAQGGWNVSIPTHRHDLGREIDLVEEFVRIHGMDKVAPELPVFKPSGGTRSGDAWLRHLRVSIAAMGFNEVVTYSFVSPRWKAFFPGDSLELLNPISDEMRMMRTSLVPGLLGACERNRRLQRRDVSLFEIGRTFHPAAGRKLPDEIMRLGVLLSGKRFDPHWSEPGRPVDFYDIKGVAETVFGAIDAVASNHGHLKEGEQADIVAGGEVAGSMGAVHPDILAMLDISDDVFVLEAVLRPPRDVSFAGVRALPRFPSTWRDLSLVADEHLAYAEIVRAVESMGIDEIRHIQAVDVYRGEKLPAGKKGVTIRITYQSLDRTLGDEEISLWQNRVVSLLEDKLGVTLRG